MSIRDRNGRMVGGSTFTLFKLIAMPLFFIFWMGFIDGHLETINILSGVGFLLAVAIYIYLKVIKKQQN